MPTRLPQLRIVVTPEVYDAIQALATERGVSMAQIGREALESYLGAPAQNISAGGERFPELPADLRKYAYRSTPLGQRLRDIHADMVAASTAYDYDPATMQDALHELDEIRSAIAQSSQ